MNSHQCEWEERYRKRFDSRLPIGNPDECWEWQGGLDYHGYGQLWMNGTHHGAHRLAWEYFIGPIPEGFCVLHHCDNPPCCNPNHLFLGTREDNFRDMVRKNRHGKSRGSHNGNSKLTKDKVRRIRQFYVTGKYNQRDLAAQFGVTQPLIGYIVRREIWTWLE